MKILYFDFGEARIIYGSAAAMKLNGHEVIIIEPTRDEFGQDKWLNIDVEIGTSVQTRKVSLDIFRTDILFYEGFFNIFKDKSDYLEETLSSINPDVIITGSRYWFTAKKLSEKLNKPLIYWNTVLPGIFKLPMFLKQGRIDSRLITSPLGLFYYYYLIYKSDFTITNDIKTTTLFGQMGVKNIELIWPTYTRFVGKDAYAEFINDKRTNDLDLASIGENYVLSIITLNKNSHVYEIELKSLKFLKDVALSNPKVNFLVVGSSPEDLINPKEYENIDNIKMIGKIFDDKLLSIVYKRAVCVLCPIYVPGFVNRLFEAFFYGKAVISTSLPSKYHVGLKTDENIILCRSIKEVSKRLRDVISNDQLKIRLEEGALNHYIEYSSPNKHAQDFEFKILSKMVPKK